MSFSSTRSGNSSLLASGSPQRSLHMSDLSPSSTKKFSQSALDRQTAEEDFIRSTTNTNREIENVKHDIQALMCKAHAYARNSGVDASPATLTPSPSKSYTSARSSPYKSQRNGSFM